MNSYRPQLALAPAPRRQGRPGPHPRQSPVATRPAAPRHGLRHLHAHPPLPRRLEASRRGRPAWRLLSPPARARPLLRPNGAWRRRLPRREEPTLENLNILACLKGLRLRLVSQSLRCVQIVGSMMDNIAVVKAPCLERLILYASCTPSGLCTRVRIGDAPKLHAFGYLQPGPSQVLEIRDTVIMPEIKMSTNTMLTSLSVGFGVRDDVMMVPPFLRCFPNAERLHIMFLQSTKRDQPAGSKLTPRFWEDSGPIENVISRIHTMSLREFRGEPGEAAFLVYFSRSARVVRTVVVVMANPSLAPFSSDEAYSKVEKCCKNMASTSCRKLVIWSDDHVGGHLWRFKDGADFSFHDPFSIAEVSSA
uniref:Uncharacterized protein n=1 Tax=Avena sativa TaxID=4498 RepID=A0ACD5WR29_AVESA